MIVEMNVADIREEFAANDFRELVYHVPGSIYINDASTYTNESGNRFNDNRRGARYCDLSLSTAAKEVGYHVSNEMANIGVLTLTRTYRILIAGFIGNFHDARNQKRGDGILFSPANQCCYFGVIIGNSDDSTASFLFKVECWKRLFHRDLCKTIYCFKVNGITKFCFDKSLQD